MFCEKKIAVKNIYLLDRVMEMYVHTFFPTLILSSSHSFSMNKRYKMKKSVDLPLLTVTLMREKLGQENIRD